MNYRSRNLFKKNFEKLIQINEKMKGPHYHHNRLKTRHGSLRAHKFETKEYDETIFKGHSI